MSDESVDKICWFGSAVAILAAIVVLVITGHSDEAWWIAFTSFMYLMFR